jgi:hypothetical protein
MSHYGPVSRRCLGALLAIASNLSPVIVVAAGQATGETDVQSTFYTYHDDWAIVSAPPPPGPYQSVNIDPRIPGQEDVITPFVSGFNAPTDRGEPPPGDFMGEPPAAGLPSPPSTGVYTGQGALGNNEPPPGYYSSREYNQNRLAPAQEYQSPYGYPRYTRSPWSNPPMQRSEDEVPPPPIYNRMVAPPPPVYRGGPAPDQIYRRGTGTQ